MRLKPIALQHEVSRRSDQGGGNSAGAQRDHRFFLGTDDDECDILIRSEAVFLQNHLHHQIVGTAAG